MSTVIAGTRPAARSLSLRPGLRHLAATLAAIAALGAARPAAAQTTAAPPTADAQARPTPAAFTDRGERLRPGDAVRLRVWREPDLTGEFPVDERGAVTFPKLGVVRVVDFTPDSLNRWVIAGYSTYLRDPSIEVTMLRRVSVTGAVKTPGIYRVDPTMTVADAVALAGGPTPEGQQDKVQLLRDGNRMQTRLRASTRLTESAVRSGDQLVVPERSWISRNTGVVIGAMSSVAFLVVALINQ